MLRGIVAPDFGTFIDRLAQLPLVYQPGTRWSYSIGLDVMGYVIQQVSGMPFDAFLQKRIFNPLDMRSTFFTVPENRAVDLATNYAVVAGNVLPIDTGANSIYLDQPNFPFGGSGLVGSARDYDRFLGMLLGFGKLGDTRIMKPETARLGMSNLLPEGVTVGTQLRIEGGFGAGGLVGAGTATSPAGTFGWGGAAGTMAFVDTLRGFRAGGYTQYMPSEPMIFRINSRIMSMPIWPICSA
ncbi:MAG: serine hydrolase domain-containing protein [Parasphingorhabdus sp.]|nr:serine hydrolase domain-containing protein [Parasphingorhabdus sp.]